jgi:hypothetical protein
MLGPQKAYTRGKATFGRFDRWGEGLAETVFASKTADRIKFGQGQFMFLYGDDLSIP